VTACGLYFGINTKYIVDLEYFVLYLKLKQSTYAYIKR